MAMLKMIGERKNDYNPKQFVNELFIASKNLGILEAVINSYKFNNILMPMLHKKEAVSSMSIEGTQTTMSDVFENEVSPKPNNEKTMLEVTNHVEALLYGANRLLIEDFSHELIREIHKIMLTGLLPPDKADTLGVYKRKDNLIVNGAGTVVFTPPPHAATQKYMDELVAFMNDRLDDVNPLIKAAILHSQFESIHPFQDGNGRVGRILISLYLFKAKVINFPFFYLSEAISADKGVYYNMLTDSRGASYDNWIRYFLEKIIVQAKRHIHYIKLLDDLYVKTKRTVKANVNSQKFDAIIECIFQAPILTVSALAARLGVSRGQAAKYVRVLEEAQVLRGNDKKRNRLYVFSALLDLVVHV